MTSIRVELENPASVTSTTLLNELVAELNARYHEIDDGAGTESFKVADVQVARAAFVVAWDDGEPVGCGALRPTEQPDTAEIKRVYVRPAARGRGISRLIMAALEQQARQCDYAFLILETGTRQPEAIGLYEACGYHRIDCYGEYAGEPLSVCFGKAL